MDKPRHGSNLICHCRRMDERRDRARDHRAIHNPDPQAWTGRDRALNPSTRVLWRSAGELQLELGERSVVVEGLDQQQVRGLLGRPVGEIDDPMLDEAVEVLTAAGFLMRRVPRDRAMRIPRLSADLAALRVRHGADAEDLLAARRAATVAINGSSRVAAVLGAMLGAAGVGHVALSGGGDVRLHQTAPGGLTPDDEGRRFDAAAAKAVTAAAPECDTSPLLIGSRPHVVVLAVDSPVEPDVRDALHARGLPHLVAWAGPDRGVVGPLALPGVASCLRCADLHRLDRDLAWSALAVQLAVPPRHGHPSDVGVTGLVASVAALQVLAFLAGDDPATVEGTLEFQLPDWRIRRRSWPPHLSCDCGALTAQNIRSAQ